MHRPALAFLILFALGAAFTSATAQQWEFEQVDTVRWARRTWLHQHPELGLVVCYTGAENQARIAWWDSAWVTLDLYLPLSYAGVSSFEIAPDGRLAAVAVDSSRYLYYFERILRTGWAITRLPTPQAYWYGTGAQVSFDSSNAPKVLFGTASEEPGGIVLYLTRNDSAWTLDTVAQHCYSTMGVNYCRGCRLIAGPDGRATALYTYYWGMFEDSECPPLWFHNLYAAELHGDTWSHTLLHHAWTGSIQSVDMALGDGDSVRSCYQVSSDASYGFYYCAERFDSIYCADAALTLTDDGSPLIAQVRARTNNSLALMHRDTAWHTIELDADTVSAVDIVLDSCGDPLMSYSSNGIWLARGRGISGVSDRTTRDQLRNLSRASIVRGILRLPTPASGTLLDASGRTVLALRPGPNDVSRLAPGVYFVLSPHPAPLPQGAREPSSTIAKVVLTR